MLSYWQISPDGIFHRPLRSGRKSPAFLLNHLSCIKKKKLNVTSLASLFSQAYRSMFMILCYTTMGLLSSVNSCQPRTIRPAINMRLNSNLATNILNAQTKVHFYKFLQEDK